MPERELTFCIKEGTHEEVRDVGTVSSAVGQKQSSSLQTFHAGQHFGCLKMKCKFSAVELSHYDLLRYGKHQAPIQPEFLRHRLFAWSAASAKKHF
ncbi:hypothetical protein CCH79_00013399 [Gambusia affinis]|uniref:Uncharacterized protein n=1 Tax=Gambusia affinis TaxID=33528 RepID=A0A315W8V1_GAMAF|nr:hypothetical protein CCH79_00013399 [Gambusia affinis]